MGQTLTHGVYLPDEGERNCYNGLAANWSILDGAVGTIAEHTSALAGKAPLVHTHSKSDITDFPAYGTTAGTICEGNDSRLSDARTPVAHTHAKSDVTDLLNSNFIPSANNSYDLGSSSYQWNNLYAKNYYYNGVAWGLDKENHWTNNNTFDTTIGVKSLTQEIGVTPSASRYTYCDFKDKNEVIIAQVITAHFANGYDTISLNMYNKYTNGVKDPNGTSVNVQFEAGLTPAGNPYLNTNGKWLCDLTPIVANLNLGTSTNKWKSLNGVNPGALSLPDKSKAASIDTTNFAYNSNFIFTPTVSGWLFVGVANCTKASLKTGVGEYYFNQSSDWFRNTVPVIAGERVTLLLVSTATAKPTITLFPCLGNV